MLDPGMIKKIEDFVCLKPRSVHEIAKYVDKNWRTADRYIDEIEKNFGTITTRVFREGTRGALKVVYWASVEKISHSVFQKQLEDDILHARRKEDFSAFDIFQHVPEKNKRLIVEKEISEDTTNLKEFSEILSQTKKQLLIFSGNISFINLKNRSIDMFGILEELVKKGVIVKILCRIDIVGKNNIEKMLSLNFKHGKENIQIHHKEHPLRAFISDNKLFRIKEVKEPTGKIKELDKKLFIFYTIKDKEWTEWLSKIFWKMFSSSMDSKKRMEELKNLI